jgi:hypothetical protein
VNESAQRYRGPVAVYLPDNGRGSARGPAVNGSGEADESLPWAAPGPDSQIWLSAAKSTVKASSRPLEITLRLASHEQAPPIDEARLASLRAALEEAGFRPFSFRVNAEGPGSRLLVQAASALGSLLNEVRRLRAIQGSKARPRKHARSVALHARRRSNRSSRKGRKA